MNTRAFLTLTGAVLLVGLFFADRASAGGTELLPGGTRSVARAGAVAARADTPLTVLHNPAGLALLPGHQILLDTDITFHDMCVDPYGYYGWGVYTPGTSDYGNSADAAYGSEPLRAVCNSASVFPLPHLVWAGRLTDDIGVGLGFAAPTMLPGLQYGDERGVVSTPNGERPAPTRYQLVKQDVVFALDPTIGVGYRLLRELRLGLAMQVLMAKVDAWMVQSLNAGTSPHDDFLINVQAADYFIPVLNFSVHATPMKSLDLMASFRWQDDFDGSGDAIFTTYVYNRDAETGALPTKNDPIGLDRLQVSFPWTLTLGARYAGLLRKRRTEEEKWHSYHDPMAREKWDVELDMSYSFNARAGKNSVFFGDDVFLEWDALDENGDPLEVDPLEVKRESLEQFDIDRHLVDSFAVRLGGSYAFFPRIAAINGGLFYESRGVDPDYANIDTFAFQRIGFGVGFVTRLGAFEFSSGFSHIFQEDLLVAPPGHQERQQGDPDDPSSGFDQRVNGVVQEDPDAPSSSEADGTARLQQPAIAASEMIGYRRVVNAGKYTAGFSVLSLGLSYRF
jgi:hypothetical protein